MCKYILFLCLALVSCVNMKNDFDPKKEIVGDWLVLYPQHILKTDVQRKLYGKAQDSIVNDMGLKLLRFKQSGEFFQMDSIYGDHGSWSMSDSGSLKITAAGKGIENFIGKVGGLLSDTILIEEMVQLENEKIKLVWYLKKVEKNDEGAKLFETSVNNWRQKPAKKQTESEIRMKMTAMLEYYSAYFKVVSVESIYFLSTRVFLPFTYYQHGVGLKSFDPGSDFANCFFDINDAKKGYDLLENVFGIANEEEFPSGMNFVIEYADFFGKLAKQIGDAN